MKLKNAAWITVFAALLSGCLEERSGGQLSGLQVNATACPVQNAKSVYQPENGGLTGFLKMQIGGDLEILRVYYPELFLTPTRHAPEFRVLGSERPKWGTNMALSLSSRIQLDAKDSPGSYRLAVISNHVLTAKISLDDQTETVSVNGGRNMKLYCGQTAWPMGYNTQLRFESLQQQAEPASLVQVWLWHPVTGASDEAFQNCSLPPVANYFEPSDDVPAMQLAYLNLIQSGWKPLGSGNFVLPETFASNPCQ